MEWVVLPLVFFGVLLLSLGIVRLLQRRGPEERLRQLVTGPPPISPEEELRADHLTPVGPWLESTSLGRYFEPELWRAGLRIRPGDFTALMLLGAVVLGGGFLLWTQSLAWGLGALVVGGGAPLAAMRWKQGERLRKLETQLPDMLEMTSSSLRSGYSFLQSLQVIADEMPSPIADEIRWVLAEARLGVSVEEALQRMVRRARSYDVDLFVTAVSIQLQLGGNLAVLLDTISETIRERFRMRAEVASLTAEGRLSGVILFCMPIAMFLLLMVRSPDYVAVLVETSFGQSLLIGAVFLQIIGGVIIRWLLRLDG